MDSRIWAVCAGKGGVGKTFLASSLGISVTKMNHSVLIIDLNFEGANLHTALGMPLSQTNIGEYLHGRSDLNSLIQPTKIPNLSYIQGAWNEWSLAEVPPDTDDRIFESLKKIAFDYVILDLGPGINKMYLNMFNRADEKILVTSSEPTSIERTYRFLESYLVMNLKPHATGEAFDLLKKALKDYRMNSRKGHFSFRNYLSNVVGFSWNHFESLDKNPIKMVLNFVRNQQDQELGFSIKSVCNKYYDMNIEYLGAIEYDNAVWQSIKNKEPVLIEKPFTIVSGQFMTISKNLLQSEIHSQLFRAVV